MAGPGEDEGARRWGVGENDGDRTHDTQGHNLVLYQLSYILRGNLVYMTRATSATVFVAPVPALPARTWPTEAGLGGQVFARRAAMIFTNDLLRISSSESPVARASCSVTAPHAMPRRK